MKNNLDRSFYSGISWALEELAMYCQNENDEFHLCFKTLYNSLGKEEKTLLKDLWTKNNPEIYKEHILPILTENK